MVSISLFSADGEAGTFNHHILKENLNAAYDKAASDGKKRPLTLGAGMFIQEIFPSQTHWQDRQYFDELIKAEKIARGNQRATADGIVDIPNASLEDEKRVHTPAISTFTTQGRDPALVLAKMYDVLQAKRSQLTNSKPEKGGKAENYVAGIRIARKGLDDEVGALEINAEDFADIASYMKGELLKEHPISEKVQAVRELANYQEKKIGVELHEDKGTVGDKSQGLQL